HVCRIAVADRAAIPRKIIANEIFQLPNPQHALERKCIFNPAATPPNAQTTGFNPNCRKNSQAPNPSANIEKGANILSNSSGGISMVRKFETLGPGFGISPPNQ